MQGFNMAPVCLPGLLVFANISFSGREMSRLVFLPSVAGEMLQAYVDTPTLDCLLFPPLVL